MRLFRYLLAFGILIISGCATVQQNQKETQTQDIRVPVAFQMSFSGSAPSSDCLVLQSSSSGLAVPAQFSAVWQNLDSHKINVSALVPFSQTKNKDFVLKQLKSIPKKSENLHWLDDGKTTLTLNEGKRQVLSYNYGIINPPKNAPSNRARSSYIHPLKGLDGETFTEDFPPDHYHHRGLFHAWPGTFLDGQRFDMWHILGLWTRYERTLVKEEGPVFALLTLQNGWYTKDRKVMDEIMEITAWHSDATGQALDLNFTWKPLENIHIGPKDEKGYGGLNFRLTNRKKTILMMPQGQQKTSDLIRAPWADISGFFANAKTKSGVSILVNPGNIDPNPGWTLRGEDNYGYVGVSWPGRDTFDFEKGKTYQVKYRLWLHRGDSLEAQTADAFTAFSNPPNLGYLK